jgi:two-component sensor histidine kinase
VKYGALSNATGSVLVEWKPETTAQGSRLILHWKEKGGPPVTPSSRKGFGSRVIEHGLDALGATVQLDYLPTGLSCTMSIPII